MGLRQAWALEYYQPPPASSGLSRAWRSGVKPPPTEKSSALGHKVEIKATLHFPGQILMGSRQITGGGSTL